MGIMLFRIVKEPFTIAMSKTHKKKYWFNVMTNRSEFQCPTEAVINFAMSFEKRILWLWDQGVQIDKEQHQQRDEKKVQRDGLLRHITTLI